MVRIKQKNSGHRFESIKEKDSEPATKGLITEDDLQFNNQT